jgi:MFS family permease
MPATNTDIVRSLRLADYYVIEALNSLGSQLVGIGIYFWAVQKLGFGPVANLLMGTLAGFLYIVFSFIGGRVAGRFGRTRVLVLAFAGMSCSLFGLMLHPAQWAAFAFLGLYTACISMTWPAMEADVVLVPGRLSMPVRLALYNAVWAWAAVLSVLAGGFLLGVDPDLLLWSAAAVPLAQIAWVALRFRARTQSGRTAMEIPHRGSEVPRALKNRFLFFAWISNSVCYLMIAAFSALAPYVGQGLGLSPQKAMWLVGVPFLARAAAFVVLLRWHGWQYRSRWSVLALLLAVSMLGCVFLGTSLLAVFVALVAFGLCLGLVYSTSIYYSLDVGENKGEHGGLHEAILGTGIFLGPLVGSAGGLLLGGSRGAEICVLGVAASAAACATAWMLRGAPVSRRADVSKT